MVLDNGSGFIKVGFAGENTPRLLLQSRGLDGLPSDTRPLSKGVVKDWDAMEAYWDHAFGQLHIDTENCNLLLTTPLFDTKDNKERLMQCLFETFAVPGVYTSAPAVFELYAAGSENGVVLGCGAECAYSLLIHEGLPDSRTLVRSDVAGDALTQHAATVLGQLAGATIPLTVACKAKEAIGFVAADSSGALPMGASSHEFELPDGKKINVTPAARASIAEPLFDSSLVGHHTCGLPGLVSESIKARDRDGALESTEPGKDGTASTSNPPICRHLLLFCSVHSAFLNTNNVLLFLFLKVLQDGTRISSWPVAAVRFPGCSSDSTASLPATRPTVATLRSLHQPDVHTRRGWAGRSLLHWL